MADDNRYKITFRAPPAIKDSLAYIMRRHGFSSVNAAAEKALLDAYYIEQEIAKGGKLVIEDPRGIRREIVLL